MYLFNHHPCSGLRLENSLFFARSSFLMLGEISLSALSESGSGLCPQQPGAWCLGLQWALHLTLSRLWHEDKTKTKTCDIIVILFYVSLETEAKSTSETAHVMSRQQLSCLNTLRLLLNWMNKFKTGFKMSWNYVDREIFIVCSEIITQWTRG